MWSYTQFWQFIWVLQQCSVAQSTMHPLQIVVHKERIIQAVVHLLFYYIFFFFFFFFQFALFSLCWVFARFSVTKVSSQAWNYASCNLTCRQNHLTPRWLHCLLCGPHCGPAVAPRFGLLLVPPRWSAPFRRLPSQCVLNAYWTSLLRTNSNK